jgi:hypothetical protein
MNRLVYKAIATSQGRLAVLTRQDNRAEAIDPDSVAHFI